MNIALPQLVEALRRALRDEVAPELTSDHARGQLAAVQDILGKLQGMAVWSPDAVAEQAQVLRAGCDALRARAAQAGLTSALPPTAPSTAGTRDEALAAAEAELRQLTDWLFDAGLAAPLRAELDALVRQTLRQQLLIQRKLIPLTDFGAMTAAAKP